ncbi:MAG: hypothetical protein EBU33_01085 [Sphingobacteriia bacterium]|nr:hypothetical protein [Sphingobacteriia bacterium]
MANMDIYNFKRKTLTVEDFLKLVGHEEYVTQIKQFGVARVEDFLLTDENELAKVANIPENKARAIIYLAKNNLKEIMASQLQPLSPPQQQLSHPQVSNISTHGSLRPLGSTLPLTYKYRHPHVAGGRRKTKKSNRMSHHKSTKKSNRTMRHKQTRRTRH